MNTRRWLLLLSLVSGLGGVVYEVLYLRHLTTVLGDMYYVHAALLCMFLLGNGIGAWLAHRFIRYLYLFELLIGAYAFSLPFLLPYYERSALSRLFEGEPVLQSLFASALLLAVPSVCIGFSIPLFSAYIDRQQRSRDAFKFTYLLYNIGAATSVLLVEFYLIRWSGFTVSLYAVGLANTACGIILFLKREAWTPPPEPEDATGHGFSPRESLAMFLASVGASVFVGFFIKTCYHLFLPHRENFAICTAITLLAIAAGTEVVRRFRPSFSFLIAAACLALGLVFAGFELLVGAFEVTSGALEGSGGTVPRDFLFGLLIALPYFFLGATIPALMGHEENVARRAGHLLLLSGVGNVVGMLGFMFLVHPNVPIFSSVLVIWLILAGSLLVRSGLRFKPAVATLLLLSALTLPFASGHPEDRIYLVHSQDVPEDAQIVHYKSTADNVTHVFGSNQTFISYNGHPSIYVSERQRVNRAEIVSGLIPALVAPRREKALVLGLGSGITGGAAATVFDRTEIVEINAAFFPLLSEIEFANFGVENNPRATLIHDDARSYLANTREKYDVIINSIPSPTYFAAGKIYTLEFFQMVKNALEPDGVYSTWFAPLDMSKDGLYTFLATLHQQFEHCNLAVLRLGYYFASCSDNPLQARPFEMPAPVRKALAGGVGSVSLEAYFDTIFISDDIFARLDLEGYQLNRDRFPIMEFQIMRFDRTANELQRSTADPVLLDPGSLNIEFIPPSDTERFLDQAAVFAQVHLGLYQRFFEPQIQAAIQRQDRTLLDALTRRAAEERQRLKRKDGASTP
ncbi:hypothetical protein ABI59_03740 [Acidobacteria bacterium Mor1]|nr:hypothetical protein ABI59_03740 [Acidobacteria bacterium Mor1]